MRVRMLMAGVFLMTGVLALEAGHLRLPRIFSDGMVLQREMPVNVWGWATPAAEVTVAFAGQRLRAVADTAGRWRLCLDPLAASLEPRRLTVASPGEPEIVVDNVLVGEVWFTAGQSNMMMGMGGATGGPEFFERHAAAVGDRIRVVYEMGPAIEANTPQEDVPATWRAPFLGYSAVAGFFAFKLHDHFNGKVPIGMITYCAIMRAEAWVDEASLRGDPRLAPVFDDALQHATKTYNGTINAIAPFTLRGIIYYQAEYNGFGENAIRFRTLKPALIRAWRHAWQRPELPFLFVQLPGFITADAPPSDIDMDPLVLQQYRNLAGRGTWTEVRESQLHTWLTTPDTGMAVAIDLGEDYDIHPPNKEPIADRLLRLARHYAYGEPNVVYSGPLPEESRREQDAFVVRYAHAGAGLVARGGALKGFEIGNAHGEFWPAEAEIVGDAVRIRSPQVTRPVFWRYAWDGNPEATLYNHEGLPATPYRHAIRQEIVQRDTGGFAIPNPRFTDLNAKGEPIYWQLAPQAKISDQRTVDGRRTMLLTTPNDSRFSMRSLATGAGHYWNAPPLTRAALRPGCLVRYTVTLAAEGAEGKPADGEQVLYANMCMGASAEGYQTWGGTRDVSTASRDFVARTVVHPIGDHWAPSLFAQADNVGARFAFQGGKPTAGRLFVARFSEEAEILRPTLRITPATPIDLGRAGVGQPAESAPLEIANAQTRTFHQKLSDTDEPRAFVTVLYGLATFTISNMRELQKVTGATDHVGAVLLGHQAGLFELIGDHGGPAGQDLKLIGADGQPGLAGGADPERERFRLRFRGADEPGVYTVTLRVVTQAGNTGTRSLGETGEPPIDLFYTDLPATVVVEAAKH